MIFDLNKIINIYQSTNDNITLNFSSTSVEEIHKNRNYYKKAFEEKNNFNYLENTPQVNR